MRVEEVVDVEIEDIVYVGFRNLIFFWFCFIYLFGFFRSGAKIFKTKKNKRKKIKIFIFVCHPSHSFHPTSTTKKNVLKPTVSYPGFADGLKKINRAL